MDYVPIRLYLFSASRVKREQNVGEIVREIHLYQHDIAILLSIFVRMTLTDVILETHCIYQLDDIER